MRLSRRVLDAYNRAVKLHGDDAEAATRKALGAWLDENRGATIAQTREAAKAIMQAAGTVHGRAAGEEARALRSAIVEASGAELSDNDHEWEYEPDPESVDRTARYQAEKLKDGDVDGFKSAIASAARYYAERGANETMARLGRSDRGARFARVPTGTTTCPYCLMLASRGFVYSREVAALNANHRNCDCRIVEGFDGMKVEGYDPDLYYDMWKHPEKYAGQQEGEAKSGLRDSSERRKLFDDYLAKRDEAAELRRQMRQEKDQEKKELLKSKIDEAQKATDESRSKLTNGEFLIERARIFPVGDYLEPEKWGNTPSTDEIVKMLGGGDKTKGSCSSLAFAYFANKGGKVVRDFRGGSSCDFFAGNDHIKDMTTIDGVQSFIEVHKNAFTAAGNVLQNVEKGKRYYFVAGKHAAVVEKRDDSIYYLELQSQTDNGWHELTNAALKQRFRCTKSCSVAGMKLDQDAVLIDGDTLSSNAEFLELMGYINTPESKQKKGVGGGVK